MSAKIIRLQSGEELLATVERRDDYSYKLTNVTIILPTQSGSIQLAPFMPYAKLEDGLIIDEAKVFFITEPQDDLGDHHAEAFGTKSNILVPDNKIVT